MGWDRLLGGVAKRLFTRLFFLEGILHGFCTETRVVHFDVQESEIWNLVWLNSISALHYLGLPPTKATLVSGKLDHLLQQEQTN